MVFGEENVPQHRRFLLAGEGFVLTFLLLAIPTVVGRFSLSNTEITLSLLVLALTSLVVEVY